MLEIKKNLPLIAPLVVRVFVPSIHNKPDYTRVSVTILFLMRHIFSLLMELDVFAKVLRMTGWSEMS